ncbi:MAG: RtcB family protein [Phycisphaerae bacterium]|nr:RtcB family protein [Phycisphaerae bacterium]
MGQNAYHGPLEQLDACRWRIPRSYKPQMRVDGIIYANQTLIEQIRSDQSPEQVANVATLPGIVGASLAMPDIHWGYGFSIGGVAATDPAEGGVISPGGVGYDINCGVRMIRTNIDHADVRERIGELIDALFRTVPCGVGVGGPIRMKRGELATLMECGAPHVVELGFGWHGDTEVTEANGCLTGAKPEYVSDHAFNRGADQCGSLGAGNHFLEIQVVDKIHDAKAAAAFGIALGQLAVMIHSGSRGLGYQVCDDALRMLRDVPKKYGIELPDRQLVCAPVHSDEGQRYLGGMRAAANYAWANRQMMTHMVREAFAEVLETPAEKLGMHLVYDVAHNIAKLETFDVDGQPRKLCVHRKGATRAYPAGHPEVPRAYRHVGQPVLVPGDMARASYVLVGQPAAMETTFGSACHGAGRVMSRKAALSATRGRRLDQELAERGVIARARSRAGLAEEQPDAYKDVSQVVDVLHEAGVSTRVARLRPLAVVKG